MGFGKFIRVLSIPASLAAIGILIILERRRPLRQTVESTIVRSVRNLTIAGAAAVTVTLAERPVVDKLARWATTHNFGLLNHLRLPVWIETVAGIVLLDYTLYLWHVLTHRVPFLWRFHVVHHADLDLDASTALRFHFGELFISVIWRAVQIVVIGVSPSAIKIWQRLLIASILFHHSNLKLPIELERKLSWLIVTPRLHGIHHSSKMDEMDSNWSSGLSLWDRLHGTFKAGVPQDSILIGVEGLSECKDVTLPKMLALPFNK